MSFMHICKRCEANIEKVEAWCGRPICQNGSLKALSTFCYALSWLSLMCGGLSWLWIDSAPCAREREARPAVGSPRRDWRWFDMLHASLQNGSSSSQPASKPAQRPHSPFGVSAQCVCRELGLAVLVTGLRWTADGALCPAAPWGQLERGRETGVFMFHLLPPLLSLRGQDRCPCHWFWRKQKERTRQRTKRDIGWRQRRENVMWW